MIAFNQKTMSLNPQSEKGNEFSAEKINDKRDTLDVDRPDRLLSQQENSEMH